MCEETSATMSDPPFTIRIRTEGNQDMDWMVQPQVITFRQTLEVICQIVPNTTVTAFEYEDEEGDRITVRSDDEMKAMFMNYFQELVEEDRARGLLPPLIIYPKVGKTPQNRNIHNLTIKTSKQSRTEETPRPAVQPPMPVAMPPPFHPATPPHLLHHTPPAQSQQGASNIPGLLACGSITDRDLQILEPLGNGIGGCVYRAVHTRTGRQMAVKMIELDISRDVQQQILSELEILYKCNSRAIIEFYGAFFLENKISVCTEYMDGGSLDKYAPVPELVLGKMAMHIIEGLLYVWNMKILHRDVKPSNVLVNTQGQVKLCDFGVSKELVKSITNTYIGTNVYMAPERLKAEDYGIPAEVWGLGVSLYELAMAQLPFQSLSKEVKPMELMDCIINQKPSMLPPDRFTPDFVNFVGNCLQNIPAKRLNVGQLTSHPFVRQHIDGSTSVIAEFVVSKLPFIKRPS